MMTESPSSILRSAAVWELIQTVRSQRKLWIDPDALVRMGPAHGRSHPDFGGDSFHPRVALGARLTLIVGVVRIADDFVDIPVSRPMRQYAAPVQADDARGADPAFVEIHQVSLFFSVQRTDHPLTPEWRNRYLIGLSRWLGMPSDSLLNSQSEKKSCQEIAASGQDSVRTAAIGSTGSAKGPIPTSPNHMDPTIDRQYRLEATHGSYGI